eukprot:4268188-Prorocentrum_lima.AAC.1
MTSSLVGSEMCIRDRLFRVLRMGPSDFLTSLDPRRPDWKTARTEAWTCPVSYTHLTLPTICSV